MRQAAVWGVLVVLGGAAARPGWTALTAETVNSAAYRGTVPAKGVSPVMIKAQVLLDRQAFSPGVIDGYSGSNVKKAIRAFQQANRLPPSGTLDQRTWSALAGTESAPVLKSYKLTKADVAGPFTPKLPKKMEAMAKLKRLGYASAREAIAERFHMHERLLEALNPAATFKAGETITVAAVDGKPAADPVTRLVVDKRSESLKGLDASGKIAVYYPATVGSGDFPSPSGSLKVTGVAENPTFTYSSKLEYSKLKEGQVLKIAAGPNNPVGSTWIDLNKRGYGIHGTPAPEQVSKQASHGCVRLTNWDARELASLVKPGTPVVFAK